MICSKCNQDKPEDAFSPNDGYWCKQCRNDYQNKYYQKRRAYRIAHNRMHLAISRGSPKESAEPVYIDILFERDKGICQICNAICTREDASIDHIKPCAERGLHTYANTRLAHLKCNQVDGAYKQHERQGVYNGKI